MNKAQKAELFIQYNNFSSFLSKKTTSIPQDDAFLNEEHKDSAPQLSYSLPSQVIFDKLANLKESKKVPTDKRKTLILEVISEQPLPGTSLHFLAEDEKGHSFLVFLGNYIEILDPVLFKKGLQFIVYNTNAILTSFTGNLPAIVNLASDIEIYSHNLYFFSADDYKKKGNTEFEAGMFGIAVKFYSKAIKLDGLNDIYYSNPANVYLKMENFRRALLDSEKAIELNKDNLKAYYRKSFALFGLEDYEKYLLK